MYSCRQSDSGVWKRGNTHGQQNICKKMLPGREHQSVLVRPIFGLGLGRPPALRVAEPAALPKRGLAKFRRYGLFLKIIQDNGRSCSGLTDQRQEHSGDVGHLETTGLWGFGCMCDNPFSGYSKRARLPHHRRLHTSSYYNTLPSSPHTAVAITVTSLLACTHYYSVLNLEFEYIHP